MLIILLIAILILSPLHGVRCHKCSTAAQKKISVKYNGKSGIVYTKHVYENNTSFVSVYFPYFNLPELRHKVIVRSPSNEQRYEYSGSKGAFYSDPIKGDHAIVEYYIRNGFEIDDNDQYGFQVCLKKIMDAKRQLRYADVCGVDNSIPAKCYAKNNSCSRKNIQNNKIYQHAHAVARLLVNGIHPCTGWLVGCNGHLITNQHCLPTDAEAANTQFEFDAESSSCTDECKITLGCRGKVFHGAKLLAVDEELDFALVKLNTNASNLANFSYLQIRDGLPELGEQIYMPQYPRGWAKRIATHTDNGSEAVVSSLNITNDFGTDHVGYMLDTQGGSSGSPVIALKDHKVIALHRAGGCHNAGHQMFRIREKIGMKFPTC